MQSLKGCNMNTKDINIESYSYDLPEQRIAKYPLEERDHSQLLVYKQGKIEDHHFYDLPDLLPRNCMLFRNNSKVIRARLIFYKEGGARIEVFCLEPQNPSGYDTNLSSTSECSWYCMIGNSKKWKQQTLERKLPLQNGSEVTLTAKRESDAGALGTIVKFSWDHQEITFGEILELCGILPIPPYLNRETEERDLQTYQTVYAQEQGSVAAPTAGLHFTEKVFDSIKKQDIPVFDLTLHVGAGTFKPVKADHIGDHKMHRELVIATKDDVTNLAHNKRSVTAVGTTSVRSLESLYFLALHVMDNPDINPDDLKVEQWEAYRERDYFPSRIEAFEALLSYMDHNNLEEILFPTEILIAPGYTYRVVEAMVTNFHQPQSTLILLVAAFIGDNWRKVYDHALKANYRFLSYGDSSLLIP